MSVIIVIIIAIFKYKKMVVTLMASEVRYKNFIFEAGYLYCCFMHYIELEVLRLNSHMSKNRLYFTINKHSPRMPVHLETLGMGIRMRMKIAVFISYRHALHMNQLNIPQVTSRGKTAIFITSANSFV